ncbi:alpha/beta hydrolase [Streptomyces spectabilis]|uniref:alpha/beta hydrolase n=1 Tax=Streptomyces spectabilis TaxID=68270 RepID=UPI001864C16B|nr:alpha/beta-hydrolase family protein [Streptomyces spectabilis]
MGQESPAGPDTSAAPYVTLPGAWGALLLVCLSFTPSLLPRGGVLQGVISGILAAIGYGLGVTAAWIWRAFADRGPRPARPSSWPVFVIAGAALLGTAFGLGQYWQHRIRRLLTVTDYSLLQTVAALPIALLLFCLLLLAARGIRGVHRRVARLLHRWIGARAAKAVGGILVAAASVLVFSGLLVDGLVAAANQAFSLRDTQTEEGVRRPTTALRSGGPGSNIPWDSLGRNGRTFVSGGAGTDEIARFTGRRAKPPIRAYAGLQTADDTEARAARAVTDLQRAGGFERRALLVTTTTGSGWVDPAAVDSFEYLVGGDSATVALQYSYLPSWMSYLVDQSKAREAGRELFDAVYDVWSKLPADDRPRLYVAGESLGSFGAETAFSGEYDLRNRTAGALFAGPPNFNTLFRRFSDNRDSGSPEVQPVYKDGRTVRFTDDAGAGVPPSDAPWEGTRVLYLLHASDPIVWWGPHLTLNQPDWIGEAPGDDVLPSIFWVPFVTFWQVTADLPFATGVPDGHGHRYRSEYVDGWHAVLRPTGVDERDLARLRRIVSQGA